MEELKTNIDSSSRPYTLRTATSVLRGLRSTVNRNRLLGQFFARALGERGIEVATNLRLCILLM